MSERHKSNDGDGDGDGERDEPVPVLIAAYLLHLAHYPSAFERHASSDDAARDAMTEFGLSEHQQHIVLSRETEKISQAAKAELGTHFPDDEDTFRICFHARIVR